MRWLSFLFSVLTQIGGLIWLLTLWAVSFLPVSSFPKWRFAGCFIILYSLFTICIIPVLAPFSGGVALPVNDQSLEAKNAVYCF
jgi:hypothetical protein